MPALLAIDPGREKCGYALLAISSGEHPRQADLLRKGIIPRGQILSLWQELQQKHGDLTLVMGGGTGSKAILHELEAAGAACETIDEQWTTRRARDRYFVEHPPGGWKRLLPRGLLSPPQPVDDFAALILAEDWLARSNG